MLDRVGIATQSGQPDRFRPLTEAKVAAKDDGTGTTA